MSLFEGSAGRHEGGEAGVAGGKTGNELQASVRRRVQAQRAERGPVVVVVLLAVAVAVVLGGRAYGGESPVGWAGGV